MKRLQRVFWTDGFGNDKSLRTYFGFDMILLLFRVEARHNGLAEAEELAFV